MRDFQILEDNIDKDIDSYINYKEYIDNATNSTNLINNLTNSILNSNNIKNGMFYNIESNMNTELLINHYTLKSQNNILKYYLKWFSNSCKFDSFFLYNYVILSYIELEYKYLLINDDLYAFNIFLNNNIKLQYECNFWDIYLLYNKDFFNITCNKIELKKVNTITFIFKYLNKFEFFLNEYKYISDVKRKQLLIPEKRKIFT